MGDREGGGLRLVRTRKREWENKTVAFRITGERHTGTLRNGDVTRHCGVLCATVHVRVYIKRW